MSFAPFFDLFADSGSSDQCASAGWQPFSPQRNGKPRKIDFNAKIHDFHRKGRTPLILLVFDLEESKICLFGNCLQIPTSAAQAPHACFGPESKDQRIASSQRVTKGVAVHSC